MKEQDLVCYLSVILYIYAKWGGKNDPFSTFFHPLQSMFASLTSSLEDCKHAIYEA